ncbi:MAG: hypothetical protein ABFS19_06665 [Thermodesulfobacteriota bacterium]
MSDATLPPYVNFLMDPASHSGSVDEVQLIQTHISFVHVAGDFVYKWKKEVDFGFLDFSTLQKRKLCCEQELVLNRRLCPEIYLEVVTINLDGDRFSLGGPGEVVEYGVKMARMPEEKMMGRVVKAGGLNESELDRIIDVLVPFYSEATGGEALAVFGKADSVGVNVLENFDQTESFIGSPGLDRERFEKIKAYAADFLTLEDRFQQRIDEGRIRDCHGDLYSANICLADKVYIFDCIEFNERFRYSDVAADVAFLAMDLDFHELDELSDYFIRRFIAQSGDATLAGMLNFYKCYRAYVRGKIGLFTAADPGVDKAVADSCREQAARYFELAERYAADETA